MGQAIRVQVMGPAIFRLTAEAFLTATPGLDPVEREGDVVWAFGSPGEPRTESSEGPPASRRRHWLAVTVERTTELAAVRAAGIRVIVGDNEPEAVLRQAFEAAARGCVFTSPNLAALEEADEGVGGDGGPPNGPGRLSSREREIANLRAQGRERAEIAAELGISENTVKTHLRRIHRKLRVQGMDELSLVLRADP